jgi:spore maturation protein A
MAMAYAFCGMIAVSVVFAMLTGRTAEWGAGLTEGADSAVRLCIGLCGMLILWSGLVEVMKKAGLSEKLARLLRRPLGFLIPEAKRDETALQAIAANVSANLLGLGNAATPLGIAAVRRMRQLAGGGVTATDGICMLVVLNAGSLQILPASVAAVRAAAGAGSPFDILPAVWAASALSCLAGVAAAKGMARLWGSAA